MAGREILELKVGGSSKPCLMTPETKSFLMSEGLHFNALCIYIYIIFYNQTWQWKIHYDYTRIIIRISIDDCPIKTSIYGEFSIAIFDYQRDTYNIIILGPIKISHRASAWDLLAARVASVTADDVSNMFKSFRSVSGWWFQPLWKILVRLDHHPNYWGK